MIIPHFTQYDSPHLSKLNTGLGNALFQIFTAYGLSKKYKHTLNLYNLIKLLCKLTSWDLNHKNTIYRNITTYFIPCNTNSDNVIHIYERRNYYSLCDENILEVINSVTDEVECILGGYLQSFLYFDEYYNDICELLKPDDTSSIYIKHNYSHLFDKNILNISCHLRVNWGCDIVFDEKFNYCYDAIEYIMKHDKTTYNTVTINIFSDDINKIKHKIEERNKNGIINFVYFENNFDYIDLWSMSLCKHNILSNSTLSWWGAYLNQSKDKIVTYPSDILRLVGGTIYNEPKLTNRTYQHYKPEWIAIDTPNVIYKL
jgi:hypothetical protein